MNFVSRGLLAGALTFALCLGGLAGCSIEASSSSSDGAESTPVTLPKTEASQAAKPIGTVSNALASDESALISACASKFQQIEYADAETGLSMTYNLLLPEGYSESKTYPMVVFIGDSTCVGSDPMRSLNQGLGANVWASDEWQKANPTIVCVPSYPETILDDHNGYSTTDYVTLTPRLIADVCQKYSVDTNRIYGTGQSMGCMTTLILASQNPDLYAGCMFVDGQWDASALKGLEGQRFVYFAAEDDTNAFNGLTEVASMFKADGVSIYQAQWDGAWKSDQLTEAAKEMNSASQNANFITWKTGTIDASASNMGGMGEKKPEGANAGNRELKGGPNSSISASDKSSRGHQGNGSGGPGGSVAYHMASFDYAYNCIAAMEWLFQQ